MAISLTRGLYPFRRNPFPWYGRKDVSVVGQRDVCRLEASNFGGYVPTHLVTSKMRIYPRYPGKVICTGGTGSKSGVTSLLLEVPGVDMVLATLPSAMGACLG